MNVSIDVTSPTPAYEQIRAEVTALVDSGALPAGARLPPIRQLAADLELAPGTVAKAYALLERTGIAAAHRRRGTIIQDRAVLDPASRREQLTQAAALYAQTVRRLDVDHATARSAVEDALTPTRA